VVGDVLWDTWSIVFDLDDQRELPDAHRRLGTLRAGRPAGKRVLQADAAVLAVLRVGCFRGIFHEIEEGLDELVQGARTLRGKRRVVVLV
jgi:hypothetical protein